MLALVKRVSLSPEVIDFPKKNFLRKAQELVGGYIETLIMHTDYGSFVVICNEDGRMLKLKKNCIIDGVDFVGDILITGFGESEFEDVPESVIQYMERNL